MTESVKQLRQRLPRNSIRGDSKKGIMSSILRPEQGQDNQGVNPESDGRLAAKAFGLSLRKALKECQA